MSFPNTHIKPIVKHTRHITADTRLRKAFMYSMKHPCALTTKNRHILTKVHCGFTRIDSNITSIRFSDFRKSEYPKDLSFAMRRLKTYLRSNRAGALYVGGTIFAYGEKAYMWIGCLPSARTLIYELYGTSRLTLCKFCWGTTYMTRMHSEDTLRYYSPSSSAAMTFKKLNFGVRAFVNKDGVTYPIYYIRKKRKKRNLWYIRKILWYKRLVSFRSVLVAAAILGFSYLRYRAFR